MHSAVDLWDVRHAVAENGAFEAIVGGLIRTPVTSGKRFAPIGALE